MNNKYLLIKTKDGLINGLKTFYYTWSGDKPPDDLLKNKPVHETITPWINNIWWDKPIDKLKSEFYAIAWIGFLKITTSGKYRFYVTTDDGSRIWINDDLVIDAWRDQPPTTYISREMYLYSGFYRLKYYFYNRYGFAEAVLGWITPSGEAQVIPKEHFYCNISEYVFFTNIPLNHTVIIENNVEKKCVSQDGTCTIEIKFEEQPFNGFIKIIDEKNDVVFRTHSRLTIWGGDEFKLAIY
uniref:Beta-glucosidase n=1 Tax=Staphylothermus marinus TaxID=2280 RepID=A0A7C4D834_STAMA